MKILLAADGSAYTIKAAQYLISHFDWFKEKPELHVLHVQLPIPEGRARAVLGHEAVENYYREESKAAMAGVEKVLQDNAIPFTAEYKVGDIAQQIEGYVREHNINLIVMGTHGHGAFKNLVMGSVAAKVLAVTSVPVMLVR